MSGLPHPLCALVVAGGTGTRLGAGMPKQMLPLAGRPILAHTLDRFLAHAPDLAVVCVLHASLLPDWPGFVAAHFSPDDAPRLHACAGGDERTHSVEAGLNALRALGLPPHSLVAIHDGVRPFIDDALLQRGFALAAQTGNATAAVPVKSSMRMKTAEGSVAVDRSQYFHVQTPQIFRLLEIAEAYAQRPLDQAFTDDASLAEARGMAIQLFDGHYDNLKVTTLEDLYVAEQMLKKRQATK